MLVRSYAKEQVEYFNVFFYVVGIEFNAELDAF